MKQFFKYIFATVIGLILFSVIGFFFILFSFIGILASSDSATEPTIKPHSVYCIDMRGVVSERSDEDAYTAAIMQALYPDYTTQYGLNDLLANISVAKENPNIEGIYLKGGALQMGAATAAQLRDALLDFKQSGKFIVAYADTYQQNSYYLASCADHLMLNADGSLDWHGQSIMLDFYPRLLSKLGIEMQVVKVGTFKSAVEPFILTGMSDANRLQYTVLLQDMWKDKLEKVSASRGISIDSLNLLADAFMMLQPQQDLVTAHLIDTLCYAQDVDSLLTLLTGTEDFNLLTSIRLPQPKTKVQKNQIALLYAEGDITDETGDGIVGTDMVATIDQLTNDQQVKAVVLRINSGGGSAYASEQIHHALTLLKQNKPLVVSMGDYAASGGYYIACPADFIFAQQTTLTGSIGIFGMVPSFAKTADMVGIDFDGVKTNQHADLQQNMTLRGMNAEERALLQEEINRGYELFTLRCAQGRNLPQDSIKAIGEGRVWSGSRALQIHLIDSLGGIQEAICKAAELADLNEDNYTVVEYPEPEDKLTSLINAFSASITARFPARQAEKTIEATIGRDAYQSLLYLQKIQNDSPVQARLLYPLIIQ